MMASMPSVTPVTALPGIHPASCCTCRSSARSYMRGSSLPTSLSRSGGPCTRTPSRCSPRRAGSWSAIDQVKISPCCVGRQVSGTSSSDPTRLPSMVTPFLARPATSSPSNATLVTASSLGGPSVAGVARFAAAKRAATGTTSPCAPCCLWSSDTSAIRCAWGRRALCALDGRAPPHWCARPLATAANSCSTRTDCCAGSTHRRSDHIVPSARAHPDTGQAISTSDTPA